ncbi:cyclic-phosphate processing receiver domain-containing protein [Roseibium suaedae]|uniref:cyclic-phosphate processing receiver domain-containing protein n=1 Tax=Roseibium suaedae TaxID=735517 RepID=UPI001114E83E|nr:cyclic-phosphate processing receiver domain-containing protein [Roseibium suaedae]
MIWKLFLDDDADNFRRPEISIENPEWRKAMDLPTAPPNTEPRLLGSWKIARSYKEAIDLFSQFGLPLFASFDHDLADGRDGISVAKRMIELDLDADGSLLSRFFCYEVHSGNRVGRENISGLLNGYLVHRASEADLSGLRPGDLLAGSSKEKDAEEFRVANALGWIEGV